MPAPPVASEEEVANLACGHIGGGEVVSFDDETPAARETRRWFATARRATLRAHDWNFARAWAFPSSVSPAAAGPLLNRFTLPADCVAVREVKSARDADPLGADEWALESASVTDTIGAEIEAALLVCNETAPIVGYTRDVVAVRLWDAQFVLAFTHQLAALCAPKLARDASAVKVQVALFGAALPAAKRSDMQEKARSVKPIGPFSWGRARR